MHALLAQQLRLLFGDQFEQPFYKQQVAQIVGGLTQNVERDFIERARLIGAEIFIRKDILVRFLYQPQKLLLLYIIDCNNQR